MRMVWMRGCRRVLAVAMLAGVVTGSAQTPAVAGDPVAKMQELVQSYAKSKVLTKEFMGSVLVAKGDKVLLDQGYGSANLEWGVSNAPDTKFRLGSLTKQFTAASILLLEERGKLSTDDLVKKYVPDAPAAWDKMTLYEVLTHTSGIPNFTAFPEYRTTEWKDTTPTELVARFKDKPLDFEPGTQFRYSNSGYVLLGYILEKVAGEPYAKFVHENLFAPLGMADTGVDRNVIVLPHRAQGYEAHSDGPKIAGYINMTVPFSAGDLYSTTEDLLKWERGLFGGKVLTAASLKKMTTPNKANYAFGLEVQPLAGHKVYVHGGGIEGFTTALAYFPDDGPMTVVVLSNLGGASDEIAQGLAKMMLGMPVKLAPEMPAAHTEVTVPPKVLEEYVGTYQLSPKFAVTIAVEAGHLTAQGTGQKAAPIFAESETKFFAKVVEAEFEFNRDAAGKVVSMTLYQNGNEIKGMKN